MYFVSTEEMFPGENEERQLRELKRFHKEQKNVQQLEQISLVERKKNRGRFNPKRSRVRSLSSPENKSLKFSVRLIPFLDDALVDLHASILDIFELRS